MRQHSVAEVQESPADLQKVLAVHTEPLQVPQQGVVALQGSPAATHTAASLPPGGTGPPH
ncbi:MAG: hypothetical protein JNK82_16845 [Myxococcaceae bacterium]|nr:hypothetical protein [Myxococcaceae bacterium]